MGALSRQFAVVTGASSGIGFAVAASLAAQGTALALIGRDLERLHVAQSAVARYGITAEIHTCDLSDDAQRQTLLTSLVREHDRVELLVHAAGIIRTAPFATSALSEFDDQYRINLRAPFALTQGLLPALARGRGQVVFINSSVGLRGKEHVGAYAATKHALKALADTLRMEVNPLGIRVLSVYAGTTATAMQKTLHANVGAPYVPETMLQPEDIATAIVNCLSLPRTAEVTDLHIRPMIKPA